MDTFIQSTQENIRAKVGYGWLKAATVSYLLVFTIYPFFFSADGYRFFLAAIPFIIFFEIDRALIRHARRAAQEARNQSAKSIVARIRSGESVNFGLYLRSFALDRFRGIELKQKPWWLPPGEDLIDEEKYAQFETSLSDAIRGEQPLVSLGRDDAMLGAGRLVEKDETWFVQFELLAQYASEIILIPHSSQGVQDEIQHLQSQRLLSKTIFIIPPQDYWPRLATEWDAIQGLAQKLGLEFPYYATQGRLFCLNDNGRLSVIVNLDQSLVNAITVIREKLRGNQECDSELLLDIAHKTIIEPLSPETAVEPKLKQRAEFYEMLAIPPIIMLSGYVAYAVIYKYSDAWRDAWERSRLIPLVGLISVTLFTGTVFVVGTVGCIVWAGYRLGTAFKKRAD